ncbi:MAG: twin-arginine translocation signal domain-containing protein, partial [Kiritimatiellae bacterium]|nr:twin-arginine translocation signal domain-containing protein [Kiritimatiellia bacterium]
MKTGNGLEDSRHAGNPHVAPAQCRDVASRADEGEVLSSATSGRGYTLCNRRNFIKAGAAGTVSMAGGAMFAGNVLENPGRKGKERILAYSPPYGQHYLMDIETVNFMHQCGIDVVKLILSNSIAAYGYPYSPYPPIWSD